MALGGILGLIVMIFGNLGVVGFFLGSLIIVIGFFPRLLMIGLWILAGYIFLTQSMHEVLPIHVTNKVRLIIELLSLIVRLKSGCLLK